MFPPIHPWLMLGALGGAIPVIIHLLNRRRFRVVRWAAMEFLLASLRKNFRRVRIENLLLLLLRVLMVILMALALARPPLPASGAISALASQSRHAILILDNSLSMRYRKTGTTTCFDEAKERADQILASLAEGDMVSVLLMSDVTVPLIQEGTNDLRGARADVKRVEPGWGGTDVRQALIAAAGLLASTDKPRKEIFLITDLQANGWGEPGEEPSADLEKALKQIAEQAKVWLVDVGAEDPENLAVTELAPDTRITGVGSPVTFTATVRNFGRSDRAGLGARFSVDRPRHTPSGEELETIPHGEARTVKFSHQFSAKGDRAHVVQVRVDGDRLIEDNVRYAAVKVEDVIRVLLVDGETSEELTENETYHLERALKPPKPPRERRSFSNMEPTVKTEFDIGPEDFERYGAVVLANLASVARQEIVAALESYVTQGGALVVFLGDRVNPTSYNEQLFKEGRGLLPAQLKREAGSTGDDKKGLLLKLTEPLSPVFRFLDPAALLMIGFQARFYKYFELELPEDAEDVHVIARLETGSPAMVEKTFGRGKVVLMASSCDAEWNNFPRVAGYLITMHELIHYAVSGDVWKRNVTVHQPYRHTFERGSKVAKVVVGPRGDPRLAQELTVYDREAAPKFVFTDTHAAGPYQLEPMTEDDARLPKEYFAVNPPPQESDLTRCTVDEAKEAIKGLDLHRARTKSQLESAMQQSGDGRDLSRVLLLTVLAMACAELVLGQRFGR